LVVKRKIKSTVYPRPHQTELSFGQSVNVATQATTIPIIHYDEGLGSPSSYNANPQHASFAEASGSNCYPESVIGQKGFFCELTFKLTKHALETDKIHALKVKFNVIKTSFLEDLTALDEVSTSTIESIMELQHNTGNRETYPLYNGTDVQEPYAGSSDTWATLPGLTTDDNLECIQFSENNFYDALQYSAIAGKLRNVQSGLKEILLTRQHPVKKVRIHLKSKTKYMNPYSFLGVMIKTPADDTENQTVYSSEVSAGIHVAVSLKCRFNEWNERYNMERT
jgi:hypothetical protein